MFTQAQAQKALQQGIDAYQQQAGFNSQISEQESTLMVFIGEDTKAHWAYKVSFRSESNNTNEKPVKQIYIMDAKSFQVFVSWDAFYSIYKYNVDVGGFGGNIKMGKLFFEGLTCNLAKLMITR